MLDKLKAVGAIAGLLKDREKMQQAAERVRAVSETVRAVGEAGGGAVRVTVNGQMKLLSVEFSPAISRHMGMDGTVQDQAGRLVCEASERAMAVARERMSEVIRKEVRDLGLPEDFEGLARLLG